MAISNTTAPTYTLPPLPSYTLTPKPDLLPFVSDFWLSILAPHIAYWAVSMVFHVIDVFDLFPQYRLHTPAEILQRNHVTRWECARDVILEQVIQVFTVALMSLSEPTQMTGMEEYDVAVWATRIRLAQRALPTVLGFIGLNAVSISKNVAATHPLLAGALAGGYYPSLTTTLDGSSHSGAVPAFVAWEMALAKMIYWAIIPALQIFVASVVQDAWQYWMHRAFHVNKWMYTAWHARHHRLYVPYAYGALYNHPVEGFFMDTLGAVVSYKASFMSARMGMYFFVGSMMKTVDDHCGYALPWDPLQHLTSNNAAYHDIHHQSWGIKTNYSQPFFTFWDRITGTRYEGDTRLKYARTRASAEAKQNGVTVHANGNGKANGHGSMTVPPEKLD